MEEKSSNFVESKEVEERKRMENPHYRDVIEFFSPLHDNWGCIQEILLWKNVEIAIVCFNLINGLFWVFLTPCLRSFVSFVIVISLLWLIPTWRQWVLSNLKRKKLPRKNQNNDEDSEIEDCCELVAESMSNKKKTTSYEEFCWGLTVVWTIALKYFLKLKNMKEEQPQKFYCLLSLFVIFLAIIYQRFPVGNILYLTIMLLFLWPPIEFYGVKDNIVGKLRKLFKPFLTHWQNSRTKRKRNVILKDNNEESELSDYEEDFKLNSNKEPKTMLSSVAPPLGRLRQDEYHGQYDSLDSSVVSIDGLEFPSIRRDSTESVNSDDFTDGLNFGSINTRSLHSSNESIVGEENQQTEKEHTVIETTTRDNESNSSERGEREVWRRETVDPVPLSRNTSSDSLQSYEIVEPSEIENVETRDNSHEPPSYLSSGAGYVGKLFGYT